MRHTRASSPVVKLVLLGIASHDGDGGAWPSVSTLAEYALCSARTVQRAVDELERLREVRRVVQAGGPRNMPDYERPNLYEFLLTCPPDCDRTKNHRTRRRPTLVVDLDQPVDNPGPGDTGDTGGVTPVTPKPVLRTMRHISDPDQPQTARVRVRRVWSTACIDGSQNHEVSRTTGACAFCAARVLTIEEEL